MKNIAIIPARSGSKGLKNKNIKMLNNKPLIAYTIEAAIQSKMFEEIMVSTDSEEYAQIARRFGANVPFLRSDILSSDTAGSWDVVKDVLEKYRNEGHEYENVCLLQPTSPLRTAEDIKNAYDLLELKGAEAVTSVCEVEHSPLWTMIIPEDGSLQEYNKNCIGNAPRQKLQQYHRFNGAIYIRKIQYRNSKVELLHKKEYAFIMDRKNSIDIDTELDFFVAQSLLSSTITMQDK